MGGRIATRRDRRDGHRCRLLGVIAVRCRWFRWWRSRPAFCTSHLIARSLSRYAQEPTRAYHPGLSRTWRRGQAADRRRVGTRPAPASRPSVSQAGGRGESSTRSSRWMAGVRGLPGGLILARLGVFVIDRKVRQGGRSSPAGAGAKNPSSASFTARRSLSAIAGSHGADATCVATILYSAPLSASRAGAVMMPELHGEPTPPAAGEPEPRAPSPRCAGVGP